MDAATLIVALMPPLFAPAPTSVGLPERYIQRAAHVAAEDFRNVGFGDRENDIVAAIQGDIARIAKGSQLISNFVATVFGCISAVETTYYLPSDYGPVAYVATVILAIFIIVILRFMIQFGVEGLYIQRVRRSLGKRRNRTLADLKKMTYSITYGTLIDRVFLVVNVLLIISIATVFQISRAAGRPPPDTVAKSIQQFEKATQ